LKPSRSASGILNLVHLEDGAPLRDAVRTAVTRYGRVKYTPAQDAPATVTPPTLLTINLLVKSIDPLVTMTHADAWGVQPPQAFAYCTDGARGSIIGFTDFFPHPFDLESCAARLNDRTGGTQRLLVVGESVELLNEIRSIMNRIRCSTSVALDARQAFDLVSMVKPQFVLVDVGLQRAEGLRLVARLRADPAYAGVGIGLMWTRDLDANEFRLNVSRAVRDSRFAAEDLGRQVAQTIADFGFASEELRDAG
jgi:CheY-like chemotaxis protein